MGMSTHEVEQRRTLRHTVKRFAARLQPGDLVHTPSDVLEVVSTTYVPPPEGSDVGTVLATVRGHWPNGTQHEFQIRWKPMHELTVFGERERETRERWLAGR